MLHEIFPAYLEDNTHFYILFRAGAGNSTWHSFTPI